MNIILFGYRGSGKSTIGKLLADQLWKKFIDIDHEICKRFDNKSVAEIWQTDGEPRYREVEVEVTAEACAGDERVIALGGGTLMQAGTRQAVEQCANARRIYLTCDPKELHRRISADAQTSGMRPALTDKGGGLEEIEMMLAERGPVYEAVADSLFDVTHLTPEAAIGHLIKRCL